MTTKKLTILQTIMDILIMSVTYIALMAGIYRGVLGKPDRIMWHSIFILVPVFLTYIMRIYVRNYFLFMAGHFAIMLAAIFVGHEDLDSTFYFAAAAAVCVHSIRLNMRLVDKNLYMRNPAGAAGDTAEEKMNVLEALAASERMSPYYAVVMIGFYIFGGYKGSVLLQNVEVVLFIVFVILQVLYNQLQSINKVFYTNKDKSEFPARQVVRINVIIAFIIIVLMLAGMLLFYYGPYGNAFTIAGSALFAVFRLILKIILTIWGMGPESGTSVLEEETTIEETTSELETQEEYVASSVMEALAETIGMVLMLILAISVIYMIVQYAKKVSSSKNEGLDQMEFIKEENRKEYFRNDSVKQSGKKGSSQNTAYRKIYKKRVIMGNNKKKPDKTLPPEILTKKTITQQEEQARRVTEGYEKARYSKENVSKEEIEYLKNLKKL
ncbi:MAG: hypothetical protein Q4F11_07300 [Eubacteriales bacterium]|nr:hypothetical protein [Eubacteriales bacterium]